MPTPIRNLIIDATAVSTVAVCGDKCPASFRAVYDCPEAALCGLWGHLLAEEHDPKALSLLRQRFRALGVSIPARLEAAALFIKGDRVSQSRRGKPTAKCAA